MVSFSICTSPTNVPISLVPPRFNNITHCCERGMHACKFATVFRQFRGCEPDALLPPLPSPQFRREILRCFDYRHKFLFFFLFPARRRFARTEPLSPAAKVARDVFPANFDDARNAADSISKARISNEDFYIGRQNGLFSRRHYISEYSRVSTGEWSIGEFGVAALLHLVDLRCRGAPVRGLDISCLEGPKNSISHRELSRVSNLHGIATRSRANRASRK